MIVVKGVAPATLMVLDLLVQFFKPPSCCWPLCARGQPPIPPHVGGLLLESPQVGEMPAELPHVEGLPSESPQVGGVLSEPPHVGGLLLEPPHAGGQSGGFPKSPPDGSLSTVFTTLDPKHEDTPINEDADDEDSVYKDAIYDANNNAISAYSTALYGSGLDTIAMTYPESGINAANRRMPHAITSDVYNEMRGTKPKDLILLLSTQPDHFPDLAILLINSYYFYVRYGVVVILNITSTGTGPKDTLALTQPVKDESINHMRQIVLTPMMGPSLRLKLMIPVGHITSNSIITQISNLTMGTCLITSTEPKDIFMDPVSA